MAVQLNAWLADTFEWQLVLGNHWLHERHEKKKSGVKTGRDRAWEGLYHDNGSCLDIANYIHPEVDSPLHVLQVRVTCLLLCILILRISTDSSVLRLSPGL
ncbi:hypothetical protein GGP41_010452 [Bipolaris sorokiniana]|uniref:Uncharacterized protein n=1 Tax=Cochliobolus sativus TaxID=45130 RepID=A0A8H5ZKL0_COCSA|nr:hypothetical protein GGP41_010452 [Bipolaris sorokiniana]